MLSFGGSVRARAGAKGTMSYQEAALIVSGLWLPVGAVLLLCLVGFWPHLNSLCSRIRPVILCSSISGLIGGFVGVALANGSLSSYPREVLVVSITLGVLLGLIAGAGLERLVKL